MNFDVVVVGGGISGSVAAIAAARRGVRVLLVERYGFLGGTLTASGTGPMMTFHAGDQLVVNGITNELIQRMKQKGTSPGHVLDSTGYTYTVTPFSVEGMKTELETMLEEAGGELLYHAFVTDVCVKDKVIEYIEICHKSGKSKIHAKAFVDATGDADITFLSNEPYEKGRKIDGKCQPVTMNIRMNHVDIAKVRSFIKSHPEEFPRLDGRIELVSQSEKLSIGGFVKILKQAQQNGEISFAREDILLFETERWDEVIVNTTRVLNIDPTNPVDLTIAEKQGRKQAAEVAAVLKSSIPGFEKSVVEYTGPFIGIRSSRQIVGKYTITQEDLVGCKRFDDVIAHGGYPIDIHPPEGHDSLVSEEEIKKRHLNWGEYYGIPYRTLIGSLQNLITVGRCISTTFEAQGAIRVSPIAGAIGHAGGLAAALTASNNCSVADIDVKVLQAIIMQQGGYLDLSLEE